MHDSAKFSSSLSLSPCISSVSKLGYIITEILTKVLAVLVWNQTCLAQTPCVSFSRPGELRPNAAFNLWFPAMHAYVRVPLSSPVHACRLDMPARRDSRRTSQELGCSGCWRLLWHPEECFFFKAVFGKLLNPQPFDFHTRSSIKAQLDTP
jgi:hypothetical protein